MLVPIFGMERVVINTVMAMRDKMMVTLKMYRIDALEQMIHEGVVPQADRFAGKYGTDVDVSVSLREQNVCYVYARIFLNEGDQLDYQYGSSLRWGFCMWRL